MGMKKAGLWMVLQALWGLGCSVVGVRTAEELQYAVLERGENFEIREYSPCVVAEATTESADDPTSELFRVLAGYIFGKNEREESIAMTAPVVLEPAENPRTKGEKIAMTAPVVMEETGTGSWKMAFSMPSQYTLATLPKPLNDRVRLVERPARIVAVGRYSGRFENPEKRAETEQNLRNWLASRAQYRPAEGVQFAGYDPPLTLPFLRRNEVLVELRAAQPTEE